MITKIADKKKLEALIRVWHSKRTQTNFLLSEEVYQKAAEEKRCSVLRFDKGCYLFFEQEDHIDFYFFLEQGTKPIPIPPLDKPLILEQVCLEKKGMEPKPSLWEAVGFSHYLERKRFMMPMAEAFVAKGELPFATEAHADEILQFMQKSFEPYTSALPTREELLDSIYEKEVLVETEGEELLGFLRFGWEKKNSILWQIAVKEKAKGKNIGNRLVQNWLWQVNADALRCQLWVRTDNTVALRMYEKIGFMPDGRVAPVMIKEKG